MVIMKRQILMVLVLFFLFSGMMGSKENGGGTGLDTETLKDEILAAYKILGEKGLRDLVAKRAEEITTKLITRWASSGVKDKQEDWLNACEIMAEEKADEKSLAKCGGRQNFKAKF